MKHPDCSIRVFERPIRVYQFSHSFQPHSKKDDFGKIYFKWGFQAPIPSPFPPSMLISTTFSAPKLLNTL